MKSEDEIRRSINRRYSLWALELAALLGVAFFVPFITTAVIAWCMR